MITRGNQQELTIDPGTYSFDIDGYPFDPKVSGVQLLFPEFFAYSTDRNGNTNIIVESTVYTIFPIGKGHF